MFEIGNSLHEARIRAGYDLVEAEAATKIRAKYLGALEDERFDVLPAPTYVKGFLRSYADFLGLDGQLYVDEYNTRFAAGDEDLALSREHGRRERPLRAHRRFESRVLLLALAGIVLAAALVVAAWKWGGSQPQTVPNLPSAGTSTATRAATQAGARRKPQVTLVLTAARGNSLVAVRRGSATGGVVFEGTIERGRAMRFTGKKLWLSIASPENLQAKLNGKRRRLPARNQPVVLVATRKGLVRATS